MCICTPGVFLPLCFAWTLLLLKAPLFVTVHRISRVVVEKSSRFGGKYPIGSQQREIPVSHRLHIARKCQNIVVKDSICLSNSAQ